MSDNKNQSWNQEEGRTQNPDQKNESPGTEQRTGSEMGQQDRSQQDTSNWPSDSRSSNLDEQNEKNSDSETQDV